MALILCLMFSAMCLAAETDDGKEDLLTSSDGEVEDSLLILGRDTEGSPGEYSRIRFSTAFAYRNVANEEIDANRLWSRTRLTSNTNSSRLELLGVRRVSDPRTFDEVHVTFSGRLPDQKVSYALGTFQLDWGLGLLSSAAFGAARELAYYRSTSVRDGRGIVARPTAREATWWRGAAVEYQHHNLHAAALASQREWNATLNGETATLSGVLQGAEVGELDKRDRLNEQTVAGFLSYDSKRVSAGAMACLSDFDYAVAGVGRNLRGWSAFATGQQLGAELKAEFARSGNRSAGMAVASRGTDRWRGAFYGMYAETDYFAPRSQEAFAFGEPVQAGVTNGLRGAVMLGEHELAVDIRAVARPRQDETDRHARELVAGWSGPLRDSLSATLRGQIKKTDEGITSERALNYRCDVQWNGGASWSARLDSRSTRFSDESVSRRGHYLHVQAAERHGRFRPGARVSVYSLSELAAPFAVYEPTIAGAYPLETLSGDGRRVSVWMTVVAGDWRMQAKTALDTKSARDPDREFALALSYQP